MNMNLFVNKVFVNTITNNDRHTCVHSERGNEIERDLGRDRQESSLDDGD